MVVFWALITNHCGLERIPGLKLLACAPEAETAPHLPFDCGDTDACATIESGHYKSEESQVSAGRASFALLVFTFALLSDLTGPELSINHLSPEFTPRELAQGWQFSFRTALP